MVAPIKRSILRNRLSSHVFDSILHGELQPGERIVEGRLARELGVAQGTLREALQELEHQGLVIKYDHRGSFVSKLTTEDIEDIYEVRLALEPLAAKRAYERLDEDQFAHLASLVEQMRALGKKRDFVELLKTDLAFHRAVWRLSGNKSIERALDAVCPPLFGCYLIKASSGDPYNTARDLAEHETLLNALKTSSADEARRIFERVIQAFRQQEIRILGAIEAREERGSPEGQEMSPTSESKASERRRGKGTRRMRRAEVGPLLLAVLTLGLFTSTANAQPTSGPLLSQARDLIQQGKLPQAQAKLLEAEKAEPNSPQVQRLLGIVYEREGEYPQAEAALQNFVHLSGKKDPESLFLLCKVKFALEKTDEARALAQQVSGLAGNDPRPLYAVGRLLRENGHAPEGLIELERAHTFAPLNPAITTELVAAFLDEHRTREAQEAFEPLLKTAGYDDILQAGSRLGEANHFEAAVAAFERAVSVYPAGHDGLFDLAFAYYRQGSFAQSLGVLDRMGDLQTSERGDYHYLRGKVEAALHHDQGAAEQFREALRLQPDNESVCVEAGLFFSRFQDFWKALEIFQGCAQKLPDSVAVETGQGLTYFHLGKYPEAIATFRKVLSLNPQLDAAREALGFLLYISGQLPEARQVLEERMTARKVDFYIYFLHALVLERLDKQANREATELSLNEALARNLNFAPTYFQRGKMAFDWGELARALADFQTATRLDPSYVQPYYFIAQICFKQGNRGAAEQAQARFNSLNREREEKEQELQVESRLVQALR